MTARLIGAVVLAIDGGGRAIVLADRVGVAASRPLFSFLRPRLLYILVERDAPKSTRLSKAFEAIDS